MKLPIRIMTRDFNLLGETAQYDSLQIERSWHGIGVLEMRINRYNRHVDKLQRGNIVFPHSHTNKGYVIRHKEIELDERGKVTENWIIRAPALKGWFSDRLTIPQNGKSYDMISDNAESAMYHYVNNNVVNPQDIGDLLDDVHLGDDLQRGDSIEWQSRYKVLSEELAEIGLLSGLGWNIDIDYESERYVFRVLEGRNRTAGQIDLPPAIFSPDFGTIGQLNYSESELDYKNYAIVAGQGEGEERRIVSVGDATGKDRRVLFVDARDIEEETDDDPPQPIPPAQIEERLRNRGRQKLAEHNREIFLEGQVLPKSRLTYGVDYDLGDMVTLSNREWGVSLDTRITEIKEIYETGKPAGLEVTFGNRQPNVLDLLDADIGRLGTELTR